MNPGRRAAWQRSRRTRSAGRKQRRRSSAAARDWPTSTRPCSMVWIRQPLPLPSHGHDVSQVTNAARLAGGNTFTGTQTIVTGNLDLFHSIGGTGDLTKNGAPFLHNRGGPDGSNTFLGLFAGISATATGDQNVGVGYLALFNNTDGFLNTATGANALFSNTTGSGNTADGRRALLFNETGSFNTAIGLFALGSNTTGDSNTALGTWRTVQQHDRRKQRRGWSQCRTWCLDGIEQHLSRRRGPGHCHRVQHHVPGQSGHAKQDVYRGSPWHHDRQPECDSRDDRFSRPAGTVASSAASRRTSTTWPTRAGGCSSCGR